MITHLIMLQKKLLQKAHLVRHQKNAAGCFIPVKKVILQYEIIRRVPEKQ
jgi:hypothetical protein